MLTIPQKIELLEIFAPYTRDFEIRIMKDDDLGEFRFISFIGIASFKYSCIEGHVDVEAYNIFWKLYYPRFLDEAIEGLNYVHDTLFIERGLEKIVLINKTVSDRDVFFIEGRDIDKQKEAALWGAKEKMIYGIHKKRD